MRRTQHAPEFSIVMHTGRVQVVTHGTLEQGGVLRDDGQAAAQVQQADSRRVKAVDTDVASGRLDDAEQRQRQAGFPGARAAHDADLLMGGDMQSHVAQDQVQARAVARTVVVEVDGSRGRPADWRAVTRDDVGRLAGQSGIFQHAFDRHDVRLGLDRLAHDPVQ